MRNTSGETRKTQSKSLVIAIEGYLGNMGYGGFCAALLWGFMRVYDCSGGGGARASRAPTSIITVSKYFMGSRKSSEGNVVSRSKSKLNGAAGEKNKERQEKRQKKLKKHGALLNVAPRYHMWAKDTLFNTHNRS